MEWFLRNYNSSGPPDIAPFRYGNPTDVPIVGNWDGVGGDTIGAFRRTGSGVQWYLRNYNSSGPANVVFFYGDQVKAVA